MATEDRQKDYDHIRGTKNTCCDFQIKADMVRWTPRVKFLENIPNKIELIHLLSLTFRKHQITVNVEASDIGNQN